MARRLRFWRRKRPLTHPVYYGHVLPERVVYATIIGECDWCHAEIDCSMPCPYCLDS